MFSCATCVGVTYKLKVYSHAECAHETICMPIKIILVFLSALMRKNISKTLQCFFSLYFIVSFIVSLFLQDTQMHIEFLTFVTMRKSHFFAKVTNF